MWFWAERPTVYVDITFYTRRPESITKSRAGVRNHEVGQFGQCPSLPPINLNVAKMKGPDPFGLILFKHNSLKLENIIFIQLVRTRTSTRTCPTHLIRFRTDCPRSVVFFQTLVWRHYLWWFVTYEHGIMYNIQIHRVDHRDTTVFNFTLETQRKPTDF